MPDVQTLQRYLVLRHCRDTGCSDTARTGWAARILGTAGILDCWTLQKYIEYLVVRHFRHLVEQGYFADTTMLSGWICRIRWLDTAETP